MMRSPLVLGSIAIVVATTAIVALVVSDTNRDNQQNEERGLRSLQWRPFASGWRDDDDGWWPRNNGPLHGGHFNTYVPSSYSSETDDYTFEYKPVEQTYIRPTNGGYGGKYGRTMSELRFNKCPPVIDGFQTNAWRYAPSRDYIRGVHTGVFPLMPTDYPISGEKATIIKRETMADAVVVAGDIQLYGDSDASKWLNDPLINPLFPGDEGFWDEVRNVVNAQIARRGGASASSLNTWPQIWSGFSLDDVAKAVQQEYPASNQQAFLETLFAEGIEMHRDMTPFRSVVDFIGMEIRLATINTWAFEAVGPINFMLKWHLGMPRPEEVVWMISNGAYSGADGIPEDLITLTKSMSLDHAASFTAYEDGSPTHPSYPAMHSAGSTISFWLPAICKLTPEQYCEALRVDYAVSYARTVAGVHYHQDNFAGLNLGHKILMEKFPPMMAERYGYDEALLTSRLQALTFDWNTFDSAACTIGGVPAAQILAAAA